MTVINAMRVLTFAILVAALAADASAQPKPAKGPSSTHIFPAGARRGTTLKVRVGGECLPPGANFWITGKGVTAPNVLEQELPDVGEGSLRRKPTETPITYPREWASEVNVAADAPVGPAYWRLSCAQGGTASRPFLIGELPEFIETESNSSPARAERVRMPVTLNGQINGERDVDYYRFSAEAGDVVVCDVLAGRLGSRLDPIVEITDENNRRMPVEEMRVGGDPVIAFAVETPGEFRLRIANVTFHGDPSFVYRINLTTFPYIRFAFPAGGQVGTTSAVELFALSGTGTPRVIKRQVEFPVVTGTFRLRDEAFGPNTVLFDVDERPNLVEREPNNGVSAAMELTLPVSVNGRTMSKTDEDWFRFTAKKGERYTLLCRAFPPGTSARPDLLLADLQGNKLKEARSVEAADGVCHVEWQAPADGAYSVRIRDLRHGASGGADFIYRLTIQQAQPDFALSMNLDAWSLIQGTSGQLDVSVKRFGGFDGAVKLSFDKLPTGITVETSEIPAGKNSVKVAIKAADDAPAQNVTLQLTGRAEIAGRTVAHMAHAPHLGIDAEGVSFGSSTLDRLHLTVIHKPTFRLFCAEAYLYAHRGSVFPYLMEVERLNGFAGPITLQIGDRQNRDLDGIEMFEVTIPSGESSTILPIYLPETMHINVQSQSQLYCQGYVRFKDEYGKPQSMLFLAEKRNMLRTMPPVVKLQAVGIERNSENPAEITCRLRLERTSNFPGPMQLELIEPQAGFSAAKTMITAGQTDIRVPVQMKGNRKTVAATKLKFRATGNLNEKIVIITEATLEYRIERDK